VGARQVRNLFPNKRSAGRLVPSNVAFGFFVSFVCSSGLPSSEASELAANHSRPQRTLARWKGRVGAASRDGSRAAHAPRLLGPVEAAPMTEPRLRPRSRAFGRRTNEHRFVETDPAKGGRSEECEPNGSRRSATTSCLQFHNARPLTRTPPGHNGTKGLVSDRLSAVAPDYRLTAISPRQIPA
jgi:hypothetical protein